jgi:predicted outer membrane repeat protein
MDGTGKAKVAVVICIIAMSLCGAGRAGIIYVDDDAAGTGNGTSWANAYRYLQDALAMTRRGDEVHVAQGVYKPNEGAGATASPPSTPARSVIIQATAPDPQYYTFYLRSGVAIMGGYAGLGTEIANARDVERCRTILSGDLAGNDEDIWQPWHPIYQLQHLDNSAAVVESQPTDATATLDGFTIEGGAGTGLYNVGGSPVIINCTFRNNSTGWFPGEFRGPFSNSRVEGGGAFNSTGGHPSLSHCTFEHNAAQYGAGALFSGGAGLTLSDCRFVDNGSLACAGAVYAAGDLAFADCLFQTNAAMEYGGAVDVVGTVKLTRCEFRGNVAGQGGAVCHETSDIMMDGCSFVANLAVFDGGAIYDAASAMERNAPMITNCLFAGNRATEVGGAVYASRILYSFVNCTFAGNWAPNASSLRPAFWSSSVTETSIVNCILWDGEGAVYEGANTREAELPRLVSIAYSDVRGGWPGLDNIDADPCFASPGYWADGGDPSVVVEPNHPGAVWVDGDYHLKSQAGRWDPASDAWVFDDVTSPCIDAGDGRSGVGDEPQPNRGRINMGAYGGTAQASKSQTSAR